MRKQAILTKLQTGAGGRIAAAAGALRLLPHMHNGGAGGSALKIQRVAALGGQ